MPIGSVCGQPGVEQHPHAGSVRTGLSRPTADPGSRRARSTATERVAIAGCGSTPAGEITRCSRSHSRRTSSCVSGTKPEDLRCGGCLTGRFPLPCQRPTRTGSRGGAVEQPYRYDRRPLVEPDHRRLPGFRDVTDAEWRDVQWQRSHCVKNVRQLRAVWGDLVDDRVLPRPRARPGRAGHDVAARPAADAQHDGADRGAEHRRDVRGPGPPLHAAGPVRPATRTGRRTRWPPATRCTSRRCGPSRASPTATRPRCWPSCCRPARSTAGTAPGWTSSATPRRRSPS